MVNGFEIKTRMKSHAIDIAFKSWEPFRIYKLIRAANSAHYHLNRTKLASLIKGQKISKANICLILPWLRGN